MSRPFRLTTLLRDKHWGACHTMLADRRTTVDTARAWLCERGYRISRGAVGNYLREVRRKRPAQAGIVGRTDAELRRKLRGWAARLAGPELLHLALFAAFLASAGPEPGGRKAAPAGRN